MPSSMAKKPVKTGSQGHQSGSRSSTKQREHPPSKSGRRSKKNKRKAKKKMMNLPTRLARLLNYKANKEIVTNIAAIRCQRSGTSNGIMGKTMQTESSEERLRNGYSFARSVYSTYKSPLHQNTFEQGISSDNSNQKESDLSGNENSVGEQRLIPKDRLIALDCEMVGVGPQGRISALARCSIVDYNGKTVYDAYIKPELEIFHYRTQWSGIRKHHMHGATPFGVAQQQIADILRGKIVVGHSIRFDFQVLKLSHPKGDVRDTSMYRGLCELAGISDRSSQHPGLKKLTKLLFGHSIQDGEHCSVEDAKATMNLYKLVERQWEEERVSCFPDRDFKLSFMDDHFWPDDLDQ